jgi:RNA-directed DNA polymerase
MLADDATPENSNIFGIKNRRKCQRYVLRIQRRLDKAVAEGNQANIRKFSYLLAKRSKAVKILSVFRVCKENEGRHTAGVDGMSISEDRETAENQMIKLLNEVDITQTPKPIRRVYIPKPNSNKKRPLGIPTIRDRINQDITRTAVEPICEFYFLPCSYGFRPKRSCHDAIQDLFLKLSKKASKRWIIEGDIKGCFDNIRHSHILDTLRSWKVSSWITHLINRMLKAGGAIGTPQGGIISPMLANVALTCLDKKMREESQDLMNPIVRYADDFIVVAKDESRAIELKEVIKQHLNKEVGLELSDEKTHITEISKGFEFLGFNIKKYKEKLLIKPSKESIKGLNYEIRETAKKCEEAETLIRKLNPILIGWANYYRHVVSKEIFSEMDTYTFECVYNWIRDKHPTRGEKWKANRYFKTINKERWYFYENNMTLSKISRIPIKRFVKIRSDIRLYDMNDSEYWNKREFTNSKDSIYNSFESTKLFRGQKGKCEYCNQSISQKDIQDYNIHKHHLTPISKGGDYELSNLRLLHTPCHKELHSKLSLDDMASYIDKGIDYVRLTRPA